MATIAMENNGGSEDATAAEAASSSSPVLVGGDIVDQLYQLRDQFYIDHGLQEDKNAAVSAMQATVLQQLDGLVFPAKEKAFFFLCKGRALNVHNDYDADCEDCLSRAIKLNPKLAEAWCELGECHWKKGDVIKAHDAFRSALDYKSDKRALRNLSMVLRSLTVKSNEERSENIIQSVKVAKEALALDVADGLSWANLANAFMSVFFMGSRKHSIGDRASNMAKALSAFEQAAKDPVARCDAYLHLNWGIALLYEDEYARALEKFQLAHQLDPSWDRPKEKLEEVCTFLRRCQDSIAHRGHMKAKRFRSQMKQLKSGQDKELGPYALGQYAKKSSSGQPDAAGSLSSSIVSLKHVPFKELESGSNIGKVILGSVIAIVGTGSNTSFTVLLSDAEETILPVSLFCIGAGMGPSIGDTLAVPDPFIELVHTTLPPDAKQAALVQEEVVHFRLLRVPSTEVLVVNGRRINAKWAAQPVLCNEFVA